ncbi:MAG: hypothetical protein GY857_10890 [Desulfobacula sp.]|nr:hypothetical protein [Desulfobacula sp.]
MQTFIQREILLNSREFKGFWKEKGPFKFALTSMDFPPVLLEPDEWIFSNDINILLKDLMQFDQRKMKVVQAAFNPENSNILRPDKLIAWKINHFPGEWNALVCDFFVPEGHLTLPVMEMVKNNKKNADANTIEAAFFKCLENSIEKMGYLLFKPENRSKHAGIKKYLFEWEQDDREAGVL